jgi:hypothetical protein
MNDGDLHPFMDCSRLQCVRRPTGWKITRPGRKWKHASINDLPSQHRRMTGNSHVPERPVQPMNMKTTVGIVVSGQIIMFIVKGTPADFTLEAHGERLREGDMIVRVDNRPVTGNLTFPAIVGNDLPGTAGTNHALDPKTLETSDRQL